ncbi:MAG: hypothetical protein JOZ39_10210 [Chloroflexi bacterium]|nr:hypothetical protein [Chloroflexota bacterium]
MDTPDFLVIGHVCRDVVFDEPGWRPGGAAWYAAAAASKLGCSVGVLTAGGPEVNSLRDLPNTAVISLEGRKSTSFENAYDDGHRRQVLRSLAPRIVADLLPPEWSHAPVVLLAPVASEVPESTARLFGHSVVGVAPQGYMRKLVAGEPVLYQSWRRAEDMLPHVQAVIFSEEDLQGHGEAWLGFCGPVLAMTRGSAGCDLIHCGKRRTVAGFPREDVDPTGAGDVFAAAFLLKLRESRDPFVAARFANAVASFSVEGSGISGLPALDEVTRRLEEAHVGG